MAKVSVVFNKLPNRAGVFLDQPYKSVMFGLMHDLRGRGYGPNSDDERNIAWWTAEIDIQQAGELYNEDLVINLILHTE